VNGVIFTYDSKTLTGKIFDNRKQLMFDFHKQHIVNKDIEPQMGMQCSFQVDDDCRIKTVFLDTTT